MGARIFQVDSFTADPFKGNPAGVCLLPGPAPEAWMQGVAREMNLSETAFLHPVADGLAIRWFTPTVEVSLCGHATLASAHVLYQEGRVEPSMPARFSSLSGPLGARKLGDFIELDFPARPESPVPAPPGLASALGAIPRYVGLNVDDYLVLLEGEPDVRRLAPDFASLRKLGVRGVCVTAPSADNRFDFVSRFFAPGAGIDEDPVTGSAHCCLGPFWQKRLGKDDFTAYQASSRGGVVRVAVRGDRVLLAGQAVTILSGELRV
jgi:predicted PhzF superfamily epimerase YddE/YHI9